MFVILIQILVTYWQLSGCLSATISFQSPIVPVRVLLFILFLPTDQGKKTIRNEFTLFFLPIDIFCLFLHFNSNVMKIQEVIDYLNSIFVPAYQEDWDNSGFLMGDSSQEITGVMIALDLTPTLIDEAIEKGCNLICTHHPFMMRGVKRITPSTEEGRMILKMGTHRLCHYACHTNLDNMKDGVSGLLAARLGIEKWQVLRPMNGLMGKLVTYCPTADADRLRETLCSNRIAGNIGNYDQCSYNTEGTGTFRAGEGSNPYCGAIGELHREPETRIEIIYEKRNERKLLQRLLQTHPYEEPAFDLLPLSNSHPNVGGGAIGMLPSPMKTEEFLQRVKTVTCVPVIRCSGLCRPSVQRVALCGGSGSFMIGDAKSQGADIYLTGDLKYHDFQQAEGDIILADYPLWIAIL